MFWWFDCWSIVRDGRSSTRHTFAVSDFTSKQSIKSPRLLSKETCQSYQNFANSMKSMMAYQMGDVSKRYMVNYVAVYTIWKQVMRVRRRWKSDRNSSRNARPVLGISAPVLRINVDNNPEVTYITVIWERPPTELCENWRWDFVSTLMYDPQKPAKLTVYQRY